MKNMKIPRIIFNFNDTCLNGCPFCFIPFDKQGCGNLSLWMRILDRINELSPEMVSFSGCDPLYYDDFYELVSKGKKTCIWGIDTSLVFLKKEDFKKIYNKIDLISTSIDDVSGMTQKQRYSPRILKRFYDNFDFVRALCPQIVVHTLYSKRNADNLFDLADMLIEKGIKTWSLYQFWQFDFSKNIDDFLCSDESFTNAGRAVTSYVNGKIDFDYVLSKGRANGYFFVSSLGKAYTTVVDGNVGRYYYLGSIFDDDIVDKWLEKSTPAKAGDILSLKLGRESKEKSSK